MALLAGDTAGAVREANAALAAKRQAGARPLRARRSRLPSRKSQRGRSPLPLCGQGQRRGRARRERAARADPRTDNRLGEAADIYRELDYRLDYAYLLDVKMPLADLKAYAERQPENRSPLVRYAYAMRLMRKDRLGRGQVILADSATNVSN